MTDSVFDAPLVGVADAVAFAVAAHRDDQGPLLPILHDLQAALGHIPTEAIGLLATALNLSRADVFGVVTFYHDFRQSPGGRSTVRICRAEACQAVGANALIDYAQTRLQTELGKTTQDGRMQLEQVFCLGNCALGPSIEVNGKVHGRVDETRFASLVDAL
jgi:formate dehydrogenase subunit gamma